MKQCNIPTIRQCNTSTIPHFNLLLPEMFTRKTISSMPRRRMYFFRYMTMFFLGASAVMLATYAAGTLDISTSLENAVQYIQQIVLTSDGTNSGTTGVIIDGAGKIGIGTDSPTAQLQIDGNNSGGTVSLGEIVPGFPNLYVPNIRLKADRNIFTGGLFISDYGGFFGVIKSILMPLLFTTSDGSRPDLVIATGGNVGIGTSTPTEQLQVGDYAWIGKDITTPGSITGGSFFRLNGTVKHYSYALGDPLPPKENPNIQLNTYYTDGYTNAYRANRQINGGSNLSFFFSDGSSSSNKMTLSSEGRLSIGGASSTQALNISGNIQLQTGGYIQARFNANQIYLGYNGNVGIGTNNPLAKFSVNGNIQIGSSSVTCDTNNEGTIRYNGNCFMGCTNSGREALNNSCSAGECGSLDGTNHATLAAGDCLSGSTYGNYMSGDLSNGGIAFWTWICTANSISTQCSANLKINGDCGPDISNPCLAGTVINESCIDSMPRGGDAQWSCQGLNGGTTDYSCEDMHVDYGTCPSGWNYGFLNEI